MDYLYQDCLKLFRIILFQPPLLLQMILAIPSWPQDGPIQLLHDNLTHPLSQLMLSIIATNLFLRESQTRTQFIIQKEITQNMFRKYLTYLIAFYFLQMTIPSREQGSQEVH